MLVINVVLKSWELCCIIFIDLLSWKMISLCQNLSHTQTQRLKESNKKSSSTSNQCERIFFINIDIIAPWTWTHAQ